MNYKQSLEYMEGLGQYGIVPGLDSVRNLCAKMGDPQKDLECIHIAGTNGKGSTLAYVSTILQCAGYRVGRYLSPALNDCREEIQVNGRSITQKALAQGLTLVREACEELVAEGKPHPTTFEVKTVLAFWYFREQHCDRVVLETGMGGLEDATNIIPNTKVAVLASISMDHMQYLGNTLEAIAENKAGIIKKGCAVVSIRQKEEAMEVIRRKASAEGCSLYLADPAEAKHIHYGVDKQWFDYDGMHKLTITLAGSYQIDNAVLALETVKALRQQGTEISEQALRQGLLKTQWYGRFSVIAKRPLFVADGAHNEDAARKLAESVEFYFTNKRIIYIMGILKDKEYDKIIGLTARYADQIITVTPPENPRGMSAYELAQEIAKVHTSVTAVDSLEEAVEMSYLLAGREDVILAFGSLSYLGKLKEVVEAHNNHGKSGKSQGGSQTASGRNR